MDIVADENVPPVVIARLRAEGHRVVAIADVGSGMRDEQVLATASVGRFILLTHDRDFGELAVGRNVPVAGVILLETERLSLSAQVQQISECLAEANRQWAGFYSVIEPARVRQRPL